MKWGGVPSRGDRRNYSIGSGALKKKFVSSHTGEDRGPPSGGDLRCCDFKDEEEALRRTQCQNAFKKRGKGGGTEGVCTKSDERVGGLWITTGSEYNDHSVKQRQSKVRGECDWALIGSNEEALRPCPREKEASPKRGFSRPLTVWGRSQNKERSNGLYFELYPGS